MNTAPQNQSASKSNPKPVRRHKAGEGWCVSDAAREYFDSSFQQGILTNVTFNGRARPMDCVDGYESTGEAVGDIQKTEGKPEMPTDAKTQAPIIYDNKGRVFHRADDEQKVPLEPADYLLLFADGTAIAGWK